MSGEIKFYLDEHVSLAVASGLRRRGIDVLTTQDAEMLGASDEAHLQLALEENRVLFTQDADFLRLDASSFEHAGIVYVKQQTPIGYVVRQLTLLYQVLSQEEIQNKVEFL